MTWTSLKNQHSDLQGYIGNQSELLVPTKICSDELPSEVFLVNLIPEKVTWDTITHGMNASSPSQLETKHISLNQLQWLTGSHSN